MRPRGKAKRERSATATRVLSAGLAVVALSTGCHSPSGRTSTSPSSSASAPSPRDAVGTPKSPPAKLWTHSWWRIVEATRELSAVGGSVGLRARELVFFERGEFFWKEGVPEDGNARPTWRLADGPAVAVLEEDPAAGIARLVVTVDAPSILRSELPDAGRVVFSLQPETEKRAVELDAMEARQRPPPDTCSRAEGCCRAAVPILRPGGTCDLDDLLGSPRELHMCARTLEGLRRLFEKDGRPLPHPCE
jgi:hypothetical protein